jgi:hypothetical protein
MKALSLQQPWATLLVYGEKHYETRSWKTEYRGELLVHAARKFTDLARAMCEREPFKSALLRCGYKSPADLPRGVVLRKVRLLDCQPTEVVERVLAEGHLSPEEIAKELAFGDYSPGRHAWLQGHPTPLVLSIPFRGALGLFDVPDALLEDVEWRNVA